MSAAPRLSGVYTEDEYLAFADSVKPSLELVDGHLIEKQMGDYEHTQMQLELSRLLGNWLDQAKAGRGAVEGRTRFPSPGGANHRLPDLSFYADRNTVRDSVGRSLTPPTVAIEIRSETEPLRDQQEKCRWYRSNNVPVCWLIDPYGRFAEIFDVTHDGTRIASDGVLRTEFMPGFEIDLSALFARIDD